MRLRPTLAVLLLLPGSALAQTPASQTVIRVDAAAGRHPISPLIYGTAFASAAQLQALNAPLNRSGGNGMTTYNWQANATNHANDWFFESLPESGSAPGGSVDDFIRASRAGGAAPMVTVPLIGWVAKLGPDRSTLPSFSVAKYGPQQKADPERPTLGAGNGVKPDGTNLTGNDPADANVPSTPAFQGAWVRHLLAKWGPSTGGGVHYYLMDNEAALWNSTHRDVHPQGVTMDEYRDDVLAYGGMVKALDPAAQVLGPEEWGWPGYFYSGADNAYRTAHGYQGHPDQDAHGGLAYVPWFLDQMRRYQQKTGKRLLDVLTLHIYPQGGEFADDASPQMQARRDRSTRSLWDPHYKDESWIADTVMLIPRMKQWVAQYYPGTKIGITEYNWGAEKSGGGATAQADVLGIFGREGLDLATRWTTPDITSPAFRAIQMYRNYDGRRSMFGSLSVTDAAPDPDALSSFAAVRRSDGALTVMVVAKSAPGPRPITLDLSHFAAAGPAQEWQLSGTDPITRLPDVPVTGGQVTGGQVAATVPAQSVTLFVVPAKK